VLDGIIERYMENDASITELVAEGFAPDDVEKVTRLSKLMSTSAASHRLGFG
jgi:NAD+ synthase (glutamine-hydrolysing)